MPRRILVSELEDAMRRFAVGFMGMSDNWDQLRQASIDAAAALMLFVEAGDRNANAKAAQDTGGDSTG